MDQGALELATSKMVDCGPPVQWADVAGQGALKAALEEELVWPLLSRPLYPGSPRPPRTVLLFDRGRWQSAAGPLPGDATRRHATAPARRHAGRAGRCRRRAPLQAAFAAARCRPPAVLLISELDALLSARDDGTAAAGALQAPLPACLDGGWWCGSRRRAGRGRSLRGPRPWTRQPAGASLCSPLLRDVRVRRPGLRADLSSGRWPSRAAR